MIDLPAEPGQIGEDWAEMPAALEAVTRLKVSIKDEETYRQGFADGARELYRAIEQHIDPSKAGKLYRWAMHDLDTWQRDIIAMPAVPPSPELGDSEHA